MLGNEFFELFLYNYSLSHEQAFNVSQNMTYFFNSMGSIPHHNSLMAYAAYSLRKVVPSYTGAMLTVKRQSDDVSAQLFTDDKADIELLDFQNGT